MQQQTFKLQGIKNFLLNNSAVKRANHRLKIEEGTALVLLKLTKDRRAEARQRMTEICRHAQGAELSLRPSVRNELSNTALIQACRTSDQALGPLTVCD